jgi:lipopolysaccharide export LptBFGC system permease protein LptF
MKIIDRYVGSSFLMTFFATLFVLVMVMSIGVVFQISKLVAQGMPWLPVLQFASSSIPGALEFAMPVSVLIAALLVMGRLSSDSEVIALKACGVSVPRASRGVFVCAFFISLFALYNNLELSPQSHYMRRSLQSKLVTEAAIVMLPAGRSVRVAEGLTIYVGERDGEELRNIRIFDDRGGYSRFILAASGRITFEEDSPDVLLQLKDVKIDPISKEANFPGHASELEVRLPNVRRTSEYVRRPDDFRTFQLIREIRRVTAITPPAARLSEAGEDWMKLRVILFTHLALASLCFTFAVVAVPLGIQHNRRDSYGGILGGMGLMILTYLFVFGAETLTAHPVFRPDLLVVLPPLLTIWMGVRMMRRVS